MIDSYIGYSTNETIRYQSSSGGVGSSLLKWLFEKQIIETSITFVFNHRSLRYEPKLIYSYDDYVVTGSIYQEIDLIGFVKRNVDRIKGSFACFALPCQVAAIRNYLKEAGHESFIIGLTCSSQQTIEATYYLLKRLKVKKEDVRKLQYRGNGWPSGIQIECNRNIFIPNNNSLWSEIFHSRFFIRKKCFLCANTLSTASDIVLADPWLEFYLKNEKVGKTLVVVNSQKASDYLKRCYSDSYIELSPIDANLILQSQLYTIERKRRARNSLKIMTVYINLINNKWYRRLFLNPVLWNLHLYFKRIIENKII